MTCRKEEHLRIIAMVCALVLMIIPSAFADSSVETLQNYFNAVFEENWPEAENFWLPGQIAQSKQLGIIYTGLPLKIDGASPVILNFEYLKDNQDWIKIGEPSQTDSIITIPITVTFPQDTLYYDYLLLEQGDEYQIISPMFAHTSDWEVLDTKYFRIHYTDHTKINQYALDKLDEFVDSTGKLLKISDNKLANLEKNKIDYYLCSENQFKSLTGYIAQGISNLQFDAIISQQLCHFHEISHMLVNYSFDSIPLYTLPILQEGIAVHLGGRWGKAPAVVKMLAPVMIENGICTLDTLLTWQGFNQDIGMADISYPIAGVLVETLIAEMGMDKFLDLYAGLSGSNDKIQSITKTDLISTIENKSGMIWNILTNSFNIHLADNKYANIFPGKDDSYNYLVSGPNNSISYYINSNPFLGIGAYVIDYLSNQNTGFIFFRDKKFKPDTIYKSWMFVEQCPGRNYTGQIYGLKFDQNEVGLYNYLTNQLIAKYINSFDQDTSYWHPESNTLTFRVVGLPIDTIEIIE